MIWCGRCDLDLNGIGKRTTTYKITECMKAGLAWNKEFLKSIPF